MSLVITKPPSAPAKTSYGDKKVYTLHSSPNNVFAWNLENGRMKTATVVFKRRNDAVFMANIIEAHVLRQKEWPHVMVVDNVFKLYGGGVPAHPYEADLIQVKSWEVDDVKLFCVKAYLDMISLSTVTRYKEGFKLNGELLSLSVPIEFYTEQLDILYHLSD